jgi:hypothetical protein
MKAFIVDRYGSKDCGPGEMPDPELREYEWKSPIIPCDMILASAIFHRLGVTDRHG